MPREPGMPPLQVKPQTPAMLVQTCQRPEVATQLGKSIIQIQYTSLSLYTRFRPGLYDLYVGGGRLAQ